MRYQEARILYIDTNRGVFDAISIDGYNHFKDVSYTNTGLKQSGILTNPEIGDMVVVSIREDGQVYFEKFYAALKYDENNMTSFQYGVGGNIKRNEILPGDQVFTGPDGAWLNLLRGGLASMGSSPLCQTVYSALEGLVRTVAQNTDLISSGMRIYSLNDNGKIITRACFSSSDQHFATGAENNEEAVSENFEYQIDITENGITFFIGSINEISKKRDNNLIITLKPSGDINIQCGEMILFDLYSNGSISYKIKDENNKIIYNKSISTNNNQVLVKELVKGDIIRYVDGNIKEEVTGNIDRKSYSLVNIAEFIDNNSTTIRNSTGLNIKEIDVAPNVKINMR